MKKSITVNIKPTYRDISRSRPDTIGMMIFIFAIAH